MLFSIGKATKRGVGEREKDLGIKTTVYKDA